MLSIKKLSTLALTLTMVVSAAPLTVFARSSHDGWTKIDGKWYYYEDGRKIKSNTRYDIDKGGYCLLNDSGVRVDKKGWATTKSYYDYCGNKTKQTNKYYIKSDGTVYHDTWKKISGKYYGFNSSGSLVKNYTQANGTSADAKLYLAGKTGARITKKGWHKVAGTWYYLKKGGEAVTGLKKIGGKKYVFGTNGALVINNYAYNYNTDTGYAADKNGVLITKKGWKKYSYSASYKENGGTTKVSSKSYIYILKGGKLATGLKKIDGKYYYFRPTMYTNSSWYDQKTDTMHYFGKSGARKMTVKNYSKTA